MHVLQLEYVRVHGRVRGREMPQNGLRDTGELRTDNRIRSPRQETSSEKITRPREVGKSAL